jgi:small subunit ribosomal protein S1
MFRLSRQSRSRSAVAPTATAWRAMRGVGRLVLSKKRAQYERAWATIEKLKEADEIVKGPVIEVVKGGLIVDIGLRGFLPASLVELRRVRELQPYVGRIIEAKIIELDRNRNNVVLSRRAWLEEAQKEQRGDFLTNLKPGERRKGVVSSVVNFGAFVDLGGMDGLVHVSELSWKHVDHPSSVVQVGDEIEVEVLDVDLDKERISLSLKATQTDPWQEFADSHQVGQLVYGRITKLVPFGAFVQVGDGIEGLVHISEMAAHHVDLPEQVVNPGEELWVKIIEIDLQRRRISLSIKQAAEGGEVSEEYREAFGAHAYDAEGNYIGNYDYSETEFTPETEAQAAWADYAAEHSTPDAAAAVASPETESAPEAPPEVSAEAPPEVSAEAPAEAPPEVAAEAPAEAPPEVAAEAPAE